MRGKLFSVTMTFGKLVESGQIGQNGSSCSLRPTKFTPRRQLRPQHIYIFLLASSRATSLAWLILPDASFFLPETPTNENGGGLVTLHNKLVHWVHKPNMSSLRGVQVGPRVSSAPPLFTKTLSYGEPGGVPSSYSVWWYCPPRRRVEKVLSPLWPLLPRWRKVQRFPPKLLTSFSPPRRRNSKKFSIYGESLSVIPIDWLSWIWPPDYPDPHIEFDHPNHPNHDQDHFSLQSQQLFVNLSCLAIFYSLVHFQLSRVAEAAHWWPSARLKWKI